MQELGKRAKKREGGGRERERERENEPAGMTFKQHLPGMPTCQNVIKIALKYHADIEP